MTRPLLALLVVAAAFCFASGANAGTVPWCGGGELTVDAPDLVSAFEWHIVYAVPSDGVDRFPSYAPHFAGDVAALSGWWTNQDPTRQPRFDRFVAPGCTSEPYGSVDMSVVRLPRPNAQYTFGSIIQDVRAAGFWKPDKAYLVYFDGTLHPGQEFGVCGQGGQDDLALAYAVIYLQSCEQSSNDDVRTMVATHEMTHGLGAVDGAAPHACQNGHVCGSDNDLMKPVFAHQDTLAAMTLDVGHDDYYAHSGTWIDTQDSLLLLRLDASQDPAPEVADLTATSTTNFVKVTWGAATQQTGVTFRVYGDDGALIRDDGTATLTATGTIGQTMIWTVRAANEGGFLSAPATIRFKVGYGIVDDTGRLVRDTVPPARVPGLRAARQGTKDVLLRWAAVSDPIKLKGYRVSAPGLRPVVVRARSVRIAARGKTIAVAAVDEAGNVGPATKIHVPR